MSPVYYEWISSGGCEVCAALDGVHAEAPQRPHPHCMCTILEIDLSSLPGYCLWDEPLVVEVRTGQHDIEFNPTTGLYDHLILEFEFTVLCRDGTLIEGTWRYEDEDPDLPFSNDADTLDWVEIVRDRAEREAEEYAEEYCPECEEEMDRADT